MCMCTCRYTWKKKGLLAKWQADWAKYAPLRAQAAKAVGETED